MQTILGMQVAPISSDKDKFGEHYEYRTIKKTDGAAMAMLYLLLFQQNIQNIRI